MPIIQDSLQNATAGAGGQLPPPNPETTSPLVKAHADELAAMVGAMSPELRDAYERVLVAGKKMMYAPETAEAIHGIILDDAVPMKNKLGEGIANLLVMMDNQGNGTIPKDALIPVGVALMFEAADYMFECGLEVTPEDLSDGMEMMVYSIYEAYNVPAAEVDAIVDGLMAKMDLDDETKEKLVGRVEEREAGEDVEAAAFQQGFAAEQQKRGV